MKTFETIYYLKQQTPLIHFQYNQSGATLRATEVKPKLDRFIIDKLGGKENVDKSWFINYEKDALNYKMKITASGIPDVSDTLGYDIELYNFNRGKHSEEESASFKKGLNKRFQGKMINGMYFGNQVNKDRDFVKNATDSYKETVFYHDEISLIIICLNNELSAKIDEYIAEFFAVNNFGTRQSKGFGGFSLKKKTSDGHYIEPYNEGNITQLLKGKYKFFYADAVNNNAFTLANSIYTTMKTGVNRPGAGRVKGYLLYYFLEDNNIDAGSDKSLMTAELLPLGGEKKYQQYLFVRALLGLTDGYDFKIKNRGKVEIQGCEKDKSGEPLIKRFPSPVTIKIVGKKVLFIFNEKLFENILGKEFVFNANDKTEIISVPDKFDVDKFISDFVYFYNQEDGEFDYCPSEIRKINGYVYSHIEEGNK